ncbi:cytochrome c oxidase assembly factor Coa1 family protein [Flavobacterium sp.]|uniref:cytochrome c oxidase assembly factor Coa1 family protein n=1 Tax=Flavobacterium sp. TaxID=239 RepID=UPI0032647DF3
MDELIENKSWWKRNWKWFLPISVLSILIGFGSLVTAGIDANVTDFAQAYSDPALYDNALEKVKLNQRVKETLGEIEAIDKLAIVEGTTKYSNNNTSVETTIRIKGNKAKGKMDISAEKKGAAWEYRKINIRIKELKEEIDILK